MSFEPWIIFGLRILLLIITIPIILFFFLFALFILYSTCIFFAHKFSGSWHGGRYANMQVTRRNAQIMRIANHIPFSSFFFRESQDCPICLDSFTANSPVIQLACNKKHLYHKDCIEGYMRSGGNKCPLCRA